MIPVQERVAAWVKRNAGAGFVIALLLIGWKVYSQFFNPRGDLYFPSIGFTIQQSLAHSGEIVQGLRTTLLEIIFGYLLAVVTGIVSGILVVKFTTVRYAMLPYAVYSYALPAAIIAPLFVVWTPSYFLSAVLFVAWVTFFIIFINTITGFQEIDQEFYDLGKSYGATSRQFVSKIEFWQALPHISSGLKVGVQQAIVAAIVIEFIATTGGIGHLLVTALELLQPGLLFGVLILIMIFAIVFYKSVTSVIDMVAPGPG